MRKELVVTIPATEEGTEVIIRDYVGGEGCILIQHETYKFGVNEKLLIQALEELSKFRENNPTTKQEETTFVIDVEYGVSDE